MYSKDKASIDSGIFKLASDGRQTAFIFLLTLLLVIFVKIGQDFVVQILPSKLHPI